MDLIQGTQGAVGAQYPLENDNQTLIVIQSVLSIGGNTDPNVFAVYGKDGTVRQYGGSTAQLSFASSYNVNAVGIAAWYEYALTDSNGNVVNFNYACPNSVPADPPCSTNVDGSRQTAAIAPSSITWTGGEIDFNPTVRPLAEQSISSLMGFPVTQYYRISQITVKAADHATVLRTYTATPTYSPNNPTTRQITALTEVPDRPVLRRRHSNGTTTSVAADKP